MNRPLTHLDELENHSIFILREAHHAFRNLAMPWSMGKDSNVLLRLALKAFFGRVPFPLLHIDTNGPPFLFLSEPKLRVLVHEISYARARKSSCNFPLWENC